MTKNMLLYILVTIFLFACATPEKYDSKLNRFLGQNVSVLLENWGQPSAKKIISDSDEVITYTKANRTYVPSEFYVYNQTIQNDPDNIYQPFISEYDFSAFGESLGEEVEYLCQTSFLVQDNIISGWTWKGNDCFSY